MKLLTVSFLLPVWAVGQSQTSAGSCSPNIVSSGSGAVTVQLNGSCNGVDPRVVRDLTQGVQKFLIQFPKTIGHLNELLDKKDVELTTKAREIDNWIKKYNELSKELQEVSGKQLQPQPAADDVSRKAAEALDRGDLGIAETLLNDLHAEVESGELAARAEVLLAQDPSAARDMAIAAWAKKHTGAARNALVDTHSAPVLTIDPGRFSVGSFSPDGQRAVTGGTYSTMLVIWDAATGKALTRTEGKQGALNGYSIGTRGVEFSSDSRRVLGTFNGEPPTVIVVPGIQTRQ